MSGPRDAPTLAELASHVGYELELMAHAASNLAQATPDSIDATLALEAMLVHARCLIDFLGLRADEIRENDDLWHRDFTRHWDSATARSEFWKTRDEINKRLAHLTWRRARTDNSWQFGDLTQRILRAFRRFVIVLEADIDSDPEALTALRRALAQAARIAPRRLDVTGAVQSATTSSTIGVISISDFSGYRRPAGS